MPLNNDQIKFIETKVRSLGSYERAKEFYNRDSLVCEYALKYARGYYYGTGDKEKKGRRTKAWHSVL